MTKKSEGKGQVKGADAEQKVLKKIKDGDKAAKKDKKDKKQASASVDKAPKVEKTSSKTDKASKVEKTEKSKSDKPIKQDKSEMTGKRTFAQKDGDKKSGKAGTGTGQQPVLNRRQKQRVSDLIKKLRVSTIF